MKETTLKKEFTQRDVQRMRNLITKNYGDATRAQVGYEKKAIQRKEGDVWEEDGKKWTIQNGIKQSITKFDKFKQLVILPLTCPRCKAAVKAHELNKKMFAIHQVCFECVLKVEQEMKVNGTYEEYEKRMMNANKTSMVEDLEKVLDAWLNDKDTFVTEQGDVEDWGDTGKKKEIYQEAKEYLKKIQDVDL